MLSELDVFRSRFAQRGGAQLGPDVPDALCIDGLLPHQRSAVRRINGWPLCGRALCAVRLHAARLCAGASY